MSGRACHVAGTRSALYPMPVSGCSYHLQAWVTNATAAGATERQQKLLAPKRCFCTAPKVGFALTVSSPTAETS